MTYTLGMFVSSARGGAAVAIASEGKILSSYNTGEKVRPSENLLSSVETILSDNHLTLMDLSAVCCDNGPGSFTGIRVGHSVLFGLARGLGLKTAGASSLELIASALSLRENGQLKAERVLPVVPAGRNEFFAAVFEAGGGYGAVEVVRPAILTKDAVLALSSEYEAPLVMVASKDAELFEDVFEVLLEDCASVAALCASKALQSTDYAQNHRAEPMYIRRSWAEEAKDNVR